MDIPGRIALGATVSSRDNEFAALVERQSVFVFRVVYSVLRNVHDAEDVVQDVFLKLYRLRCWDTMENERAFLARTAWRMAVEYRPSRRSAEFPEHLASGAEDPEAAAIALDRDALVARLIESLPEELRRTLALSAVDQLSSQEIAAIMGVPEGTVRTRLMRAREILKQKLSAVLGGRHAR